MKIGLPILVIVVLCTIYNSPSDAYPSNGGTESESSGEEDSEGNVNAILALEGEAINHSDNEYDIVHKVVIEHSIDEDDEAGVDDDEEDNEDDDDDDNDDGDNDDDEDDNEDDIPPYKKYKKWRGWKKHQLFVIILGG